MGTEVGTDIDVTCGSCGAALNEASNTPPEARRPCERCGSMARSVKVHAKAATALAVAVRPALVRGWDSNALTLAGVLYGILVAVAGVIVAAQGWVAVIVYAIVAVLGAALGLTVFQQAVISAMRSILRERMGVRDRLRAWRGGRRGRG
jgi:hypothetical protein